MKRNMIRGTMFVLVLGFFFVTALRGEEKTTKSGDTDTGRYQIVSIKHPDEATLLLDTKTGKVWKYEAERVFSIDKEGKFQNITIGNTYFNNDIEVLGLHESGLHRKLQESNQKVLDQISQKNERENKK